MVRVILVEPEGAENVGMVARAMANMGRERLVLVRPACDHLSPPAQRYAVHAESILEGARVCETLAEALDGVDLRVAVTRRHGQYRMPDLYLPEFPAFLAEFTGREVALVFGRERTGLTSEEVQACDLILTIPSSGSCPSLNLAQAVMVVLYELMRASFLSLAPNREEDLRPYLEEAVVRAREVLEKLGYYRNIPEEKVAFSVRKVIARMVRDRETAVRVSRFFSHVAARLDLHGKD
ncbi:tRNA/rRNA methyltransferase (SpoU) [Spirochaeta thermophila DSM 6578]|uniref:tRNA (cytidine/uridine-2'-O-)-methyltransferase TrmJ n=1 Tax=Winmispira thermophila (strain ATCC 700085 / DSM 6578 / Z-1203) TaxID=869211 RepID=G0GC67_WINT7|nr:RNA methyltransferase [Spirochaeta thermophila]AEJ60431.1 tRNA/rRNA methyltransferase (SpoU) [Spirochaeta thermophila DSM 6578]